MRLMILLAVAPCLRAQNAFYLDLSGDWRTILGDDPAYARPDFDDSHWAMFHLPTPIADPDYNRTRWVRLSFAIPAGTHR